MSYKTLDLKTDKYEYCSSIAEEDIPSEVYWCSDCKVPIVKAVNSIDKNICPCCGRATGYLCADLRPVFPEERLLLEIILSKPLAFAEKNVWASNNRYYINGDPIVITNSYYKKHSPDDIRAKLDLYRERNRIDFYNESIERFVSVNKRRLDYISDEAFSFIQTASAGYPHECIVLSFSGGKDSTVTSDLVVRAHSDPSIVHIFGNTTLEFPLTEEYVQRFKKSNPKIIFKTAMNKELNFYDVCEEIGPPARVLRWCCSMFKTGPITRVLNGMFRDQNIITFYGVRKSESVNRSKYNRVEDNAESVKIQRQKVASPIFFWKDIDIWLYILSEGIDFNSAYRLGYDRVGCWCCPNNNARAQFLSQIYMPEQSKKWRAFLVDFAKQIGKPDAENYVDSGKWKARQGGNGIVAAGDVKIRYTNCTSEENAKIYQLNKRIDENFIGLFIPFGRISPELGRKMINETIVVDIKTNVPILSIQPFSQDGYEYAAAS